ncbi:MAG TPA: FkbM family methyltransferase [Candidatus Solibacter sp.]|nr:FkbM family methyltransferase [Candidatus Solibacter sp.]
MTIELIVALAILAFALGGALLAFRMRRAGLALHRQLDALRDELQAQRKENSVIRQDLSALRAEHAHQAARDDENLARIRDAVLTLASAAPDLTATAHRTESGLQHLATEAHELAASGRDAIELMARRPTTGIPVDASFLDGKTEEEILALAASIAVLRPLVPYPCWRSDADLQNPDLAFQLRRWIWEYFNQRGREPVLDFAWHAGTRLRLYLGADLSRQAYIAGCFEPNEFALLDRLLKPGMTFIDAGANEGYYTVFAAKRVGSAGIVWAFEPSSRELERLRENLRINQIEAKVFPCALADAGGTADLAIGESEHAGQNTLGRFAYPIAQARTEPVELRRLDDLVAEFSPARIDILKIDVEGAEWRVLNGARETLRKCSPVILFEMSEDSLKSQGSSREQVLELIRDAGYRLYVFDRHTGLPAPAVSGMFTDNMVAFPEEMPTPDAALLPWPIR